MLHLVTLTLLSYLIAKVGQEVLRVPRKSLETQSEYYQLLKKKKRTIKITLIRKFKKTQMLEIEQCRSTDHQSFI
jgi:hypothetical protein